MYILGSKSHWMSGESACQLPSDPTFCSSTPKLICLSAYALCASLGQSQNRNCDSTKATQLYITFSLKGTVMQNRGWKNPGLFCSAWCQLLSAEPSQYILLYGHDGKYRISLCGFWLNSYTWLHSGSYLTMQSVATYGLHTYCSLTRNEFCSFLASSILFGD